MFFMYSNKDVVLCVTMNKLLNQFMIYNNNNREYL